MFRQIPRLVERNRHSTSFRSYRAVFGNGEITIFRFNANA
jgi:hypothetical protein